MVFIDDISFGYTNLYSGDDIVETRVDSVDVNYRVIQDGNVVRGSASVDFAEYKEMKYNDLLKLMKDNFNKTIKEVK